MVTKLDAKLDAKCKIMLKLDAKLDAKLALFNLPCGTLLIRNYLMNLKMLQIDQFEKFYTINRNSIG